MEKFVLEEGSVSVSNTELKLEFDRFKIIKKDVLIWCFVIAYGMDMTEDFRNGELPNTVYDYFKAGIFILLGLLVLMYIYDFIFKKNFKATIVINDIEKIHIDENFDNDHITELDIVRNNGRVQKLKFRKLENQLEPFLDLVQKRNTRIVLKNMI